MKRYIHRQTDFITNNRKWAHPATSKILEFYVSKLFSNHEKEWTNSAYI